MDSVMRRREIFKSLRDTIREQTRQHLRSSTPRRGVETPTIRECASVLASLAASNLSECWPRSATADMGAIDVVDIFSGCGGMSSGFRAFNAIVPAYNLVSAIDIDAVANETYYLNLNLRPVNADVAAIAQNRRSVSQALGISNERRRPLVLIGCAPCQGFSSHRNATGRGDVRNSLFVDFVKIAVAAEPDAVVMENVPELLTDRYWTLVRKARQTLEASGYFVHIAVHNMAEFGAPQERFRALILGLKRPVSPPHGFLDRDSFKTVRQAIGRLRPIRPGERDSKDPMHYTAGHRQSTIETIQAVPKDGGSRPDHVGPACLMRAKIRNGRAVYEDVYGRLSWDRPAITITAHARNPASGRYVHPEQHRGLSIREAALLQGFPSDYFFSGSLDQRFRQIGNAVPPVFSAFLAGYLLGELAAPVEERRAMHVTGIESPVGPSFSRLIPALKAGHRELATSSDKVA